MNLTLKTMTLKPLVTTPVAITGSIFVVKYSSASFELSVDGGEWLTLDKGWRFSIAPRKFSTFLLRNPSTNVNGPDITVSFFVGTAEMNFSPDGFIKDAPSYTKSGTTGIGAAATLNFPGFDASGNMRKQIVITNPMAAGYLMIVDNQFNEIGRIAAGQAWKIETSGYVGVMNYTAAVQQAIVLEVFYS